MAEAKRVCVDDVIEADMVQRALNAYTQYTKADEDFKQQEAVMRTRHDDELSATRQRHREELSKLFASMPLPYAHETITILHELLTMPIDTSLVVLPADLEALYQDTTVTGLVGGYEKLNAWLVRNFRVFPYRHARASGDGVLEDRDWVVEPSDILGLELVNDPLENLTWSTGSDWTDAATDAADEGSYRIVDYNDNNTCSAHIKLLATVFVRHK